MIRRIWIAFYAFAIVFLAAGFLAVALFCLADMILTHGLPWPFLLSVFALGLLLWFAWRLLKLELASLKGQGDDSSKSSSAQLPEGGRNRARMRKIPGFDPISRFAKWFWRIGGLDDVKSPLLLTPFGAWFMVFLSSPILIFALVALIRTEVFLHRSVSAEGIVIRLVADRDETVHYAPVFTFTAQNGRATTIQSLNYSAPAEFSVGQKVAILYEKDHPERARIATHWQVHAAEDVGSTIGLLFAGIGFGSLIYQTKRSRRTSVGKRFASRSEANP
jgi:hypothetical protein